MSGTFQGRVVFASVRFDGSQPSFLSQSGDFEPTIESLGDGPGIERLTLKNPIDPSEAFYVATPRESGANTISVSDTTDTTITLQLRTGASLAAVDFDLIVLVKPVQ
jgi:hypothetical protein